MSDPAKYRPRSEVDEMRNHHDPIEMLKSEMLKEGYTEEAYKHLDKEVKEIVQDAADFAQESPIPDEKELWTDILVED